MGIISNSPTFVHRTFDLFPPVFGHHRCSHSYTTLEIAVGFYTSSMNALIVEYSTKLTWLKVETDSVCGQHVGIGFNKRLWC